MHGRMIPDPDQALDPAGAFAARARRALLPAPLTTEQDRARHGCHVIAGVPADPEFLAAARPAAVLFPVVARKAGPTVLLTERAAHLSNHAGQVAFPGGRIEPGEAPLDAALREAREEIGLAAGHVTPLGYLPPYYSGTGFRVETVVALVEDAAAFAPDPSEVARVFEIPLDAALDIARYRSGTIYFKGQERLFYVLDHEAGYIWGVTAAILRSFAERY